MEMVLFSLEVDVFFAIICAAACSWMWYDSSSPIAIERRNHCKKSTLFCSIGLTFLLKTLTETIRMDDLVDAVYLSVMIGLLYALLEGPHHVYNYRTFSRFLIYTLQKCSIVLSVLVVFVIF